MADKIISFEKVKKEYIDGSVSHTVLNDIDLFVEKGELVVITGPSGAGKSTILNLIGGMEIPSSGSIKVDGEDISKYSESELTKYRAEKVGFVFQFYNLLPNLNVLENVVFGSDVKKDNFDPLEILDKVNMKDKSGAFPSTLSGGEQQRTAIARAIAKKPSVLLCDEPTGALDYKTGKQVLEVIEDLNREMGITVVLVTHNDILSAMSDRIIQVHNGVIKDVIINEKKLSVKELEW